MFSNAKKPPNNNSIQSLIGTNIKINGDLQFSGGLRVDGHIVGNITAEPSEKSLLVLSESAVVEGNVAAEHIICNGTIKGPIKSTQRIELQPNARILGNIDYVSLETHQGAVMEGILKLQTSVAKTGQYDAKKSSTPASVLVEPSKKTGSTTPATNSTL